MIVNDNDGNAKSVFRSTNFEIGYLGVQNVHIGFYYY